MVPEFRRKAPQRRFKRTHREQHNRNTHAVRAVYASRAVQPSGECDAEQKVDRECGMRGGDGRVDGRAGRGARVFRSAARRRDGVESGAREVRARRDGASARRRHDAGYRPSSPADRRPADSEGRRDSGRRAFAALRQAADRNRAQAAAWPAHADTAVRRRRAPLVRPRNELDDLRERQVSTPVREGGRAVLVTK